MFFASQIKTHVSQHFGIFLSALCNTFASRNSWSPSHEGSKLRSLRERLAPQLVHPSCPPDPAGEPQRQLDDTDFSIRKGGKSDYILIGTGDCSYDAVSIYT